MRDSLGVLGVLGALVLGAACEKPPPLGEKAGPAPSASATMVAALPDDGQSPARLCAQLAKLLGQSKGQIAPLDGPRCMQQLEGRKREHPELYPCTSLCMMTAEDIETGMQCSGMCLAPADACKDVPDDKGARAQCIARFDHLQRLRTAQAFRCAARCGSKYDAMPGVATCLGGECGL